MDLQRAQDVAAFEACQFDGERAADDVGARSLGQFAARADGAAGGQQVVDDERVLAGAEAVSVDLECVGAVFQLIVEAVRVERELAWFADGNEADVEFQCQRSGEDEPTGLSGDDRVDLVAAPWGGELLDRVAEGRWIGEQRRDVAEQDAWLGEVGDVADVLAEIDRGCHGGLSIADTFRRHEYGRQLRDRAAST